MSSIESSRIPRRDDDWPEAATGADTSGDDFVSQVQGLYSEPDTADAGQHRGLTVTGDTARTGGIAVVALLTGITPWLTHPHSGMQLALATGLLMAGVVALAGVLRGLAGAGVLAICCASVVLTAGSWAFVPCLVALVLSLGMIHWWGPQE